MDKNILKKAVELADGWGLTHDGFVFGPQIVGTHVDRMGQPAKDALAAQLVRQVDALPCGELEVWVRRNTAWVEHEDGGRPIPRYDGIDRTENTITVVVESKELEKGEGK